MKQVFLFLLIIASATLNAQSLKDLLYSGKLKKDSNTVIRKGDDLSSKIDTSTKKPVEPERAKPVLAANGVDSTQRQNNASTASTPGAPEITSSSSTASETAAANVNAGAKNNNQLLKEYMDSLVSTLKTDVLPSNKIKKETYYLYVDYEIETDGVVNVTNVVSSPENSFLQQQVKDRILLDAPKLSPVLDSSNKPRKVKRKYNFNITKE